MLFIHRYRLKKDIQQQQIIQIEKNMKPKIILTVIGLSFAFSGFSQKSDTYITSGMEMVFSFANINDNGSDESSIIRWAPVFNPEVMLNKDLSNKFGLFTGFSIRNVGYIYGDFKTYNPDTKLTTINKKKFRSYNFGIPLGFKVGQLDKMFFFGGYEIEFPFLYKEKTFDGGDKIDKITGWFSPRQELIQHGFMLGLQFKYGLNLKFKYYLSEFHNRNFTDGSGVKPYDGLKSNVFYFSIGSYLFRNKEINTTKNTYPKA